MPMKNQEITNKIRRGYEAVVSSSTASDRARKVKELVNLVAEDDGHIGRMGFGRNQGDATEFLNPLLDKLYEKPPIILESELFAKTKKDLTSPAPRKDPAASISLIMDKLNRVSDFVSRYQEEEILGDSEAFKEFKDLKGNNQKDKTGKKTTIYIEENVTEISVSIGRFKMNDYGRCVGKNDDAVELDDVQLLTKNGKKRTFEATSFIVHAGDLGGGHYTAYVKEKDNKWYLYNDSYRSEVSQKDLEVAKKKAYVVKYSTAGANGKIALPDRQCASKNLGNTCWANAAAAFAGSFTSFEQKKVAENPRPHLNHRVDPKKDVPEKHVHFASRDNVREFNKSDPIPNQKPIQHQKRRVIMPQQDTKIEQVRPSIHQEKPQSKSIKPEAKISDKSSTIESKTLGDLKIEFKVDKLNLPDVKESETFSHIDEIAKKLEIYGEEVDSKTKKLITKEIDRQDKVFSNKLVRALNRLRESPKDLNSEEKTWKNLTTLDRRVLVDYYNKNHDVKIDFQSLYKEAKVDQKEELTVNSQGYVFDSTKIDNLKDIMSYAAKAIPKNSIENPVVKKLAEKSRTRY